MPFDSNGNFTLTNGYLAVTGQTVLASQHNSPLQDIQAAFNETLLRSGVAPMMGPLNLNGFKITGLPQSTTNGNAVEHSQLTEVKALITASALPTGMRGSFLRKTAPPGWIKGNGGTIGNASSGATTRANADTKDLFTLFWTNFTNGTLPIYNSDGSISSRGSSAEADWNANKKLRIFDLRSYYDRGADDGLGYASILVGDVQSDTVGPHRHTLPREAGNDSGISRVHTVNGTADLTFNTSDTSTSIGTETRPRTVATLHCIKL